MRDVKLPFQSTYGQARFLFNAMSSNILSLDHGTMQCGECKHLSKFWHMLTQSYTGLDHIVHVLDLWDLYRLLHHLSASDMHVLGSSQLNLQAEHPAFTMGTCL